MELLRSGPNTVGELAARLPVSRPAVSQHLKLLRQAELVQEHRRGTRHYFSIDPAGIAQLRSHFDAMWQDALEGFAKFVQQQKAAPPPKKSAKKKGQ